MAISLGIYPTFSDKPKWVIDGKFLHCRVHPFQRCRSCRFEVPLVAQHAVPGSRQTWRGTLGQPPVQAIIDLSNVANVVKPIISNNKLINHLIGQELFHGDS